MQSEIFFHICLIYIFGARYKKINKHQRFFVSFAYLIFYSSLRDKNMMERLYNVNISFTNKNKRIFYGLASSNNTRSNQIKMCFMVLIIQHNAKITMYGIYIGISNSIDLLSLLMIHVIRYEKLYRTIKNMAKMHTFL